KARFRSTSSVSGPEPSSATIVSKSLCVCTVRPSNVLRSASGLLYVETITAVLMGSGSGTLGFGVTGPRRVLSTPVGWHIQESRYGLRNASCLPDKIGRGATAQAVNANTLD